MAARSQSMKLMKRNLMAVSAALIFVAASYTFAYRHLSRMTPGRVRLGAFLTHPGHRRRDVRLKWTGVSTIAERYDPTTAGRHPAVVLLYGSGGMKGAAPAYRWYATSLADAGIVTLICPYFDATHGRQHREPANTRVWVPTVKETMTYLQRQPGVDPRRIGLIGFSLGGFLALSTAARDRRVKALVDFFGPAPDLATHDWRGFPPTLILHGAEDTRVGVSNSRAVAAHLASAGVPHRLVIYPDQRHGFTEPAASDAHRQTVAFLAYELHARTEAGD